MVNRIPQSEMTKRIKEKRLLAGLTLREMGAVIGISPSLLSKFENGQYKPEKPMSRILWVLNQSPEELKSLFKKHKKFIENKPL
jgi:transcriptional regulator with XRE-family HTH domain